MSSHILITYASSQSFLSSEQWKHVHNALLSQFPLRSIHWKPLSRPSVRTIQELDVKLVPFDSIRDEHTSQVPSTLLEKPLLNLYIVHCEDNDAYRATVRKQIKDWHAVVSQRKNQEWIILQVNKAGAETAAGGFFQMKGSVLDKIRADFNVDKRDRCVQLTWSTGHNNPAVWADLISKIKDGILTAFDAAVSQREDEVKRSESQRLMPGWNFCTFFILKESLATSFEGMSLFEDALMQYDELDLSFNHVLREKNLSWFGTLIVAGAQDDSLPLLSIDKKPYRDLILANSITVFDFRIYLLARQCILLWRLGRLVEICHSATSFLNSFGKRLRDVEVILPRFFVESWIYSSALSVVEQTESWAQGVTLDNSGKQAFSAAKAELLELARHQLDILGIGAGHLSSKPPFSMPFAVKDQESSSKRSSRRISKSDILTSIEDKEVFYDLYIALSNRAIESYAKAGRRKFALKLHGSLAALDVHRGRLSQALQTYSSLPAHYAPYKWSSLESYMLSRAIQTHDQGENAKDQQWINVALSFLKSYVTDLGKDLLTQEGDNTAYVDKIVQSLRAAVQNVDAEFTDTDHPAISICIADPNARLAVTEDGLYLDISVQNRLPCDIPIDQICLFLAGRESERLTFSSTVETLKSGISKVTLFCPTASSGTFLVDSSEAWMSHLHFRWNHHDTPPSKKRSTRPRKALTIVRLPRDLRAFDVRIRRPRSIKLGTPPTLLMAISTGRNHISQAKLTLTSPSAIDFRISDAEIDSGSPGSLETIGDSIVLSDIPEDASVSVLIPHSDASAIHAIHVNISAEYRTSSQSSITRTLWTTSRVPASLPVAVNVQDFFRGNRLLSRFTISTTSYQHIRLANARLEAIGDGSNVMISAAQPQQRRITTITPARPANFLFELKSKQGEVRDPLWLCIRYRMLRDEVESIIEESVDKVLSELSGLQTQRSALIDHIVQALESDAEWVQIYGITGQLQVPNIHAIQDEELSEALHSVLQTLDQTRHPDVVRGSWREIKIPVDVPLMNILAAARIQILHTPFSMETSSSSLSLPVYAGQPISALLTIETSCRWGPRTNGDKKSYRMRFDVEEMVRDWLVSGRKRGDFEAKDGETYSAPITLIALHHGELQLPKVSVTALPLAGEMTMGSFSLPNAETYQVHGAEKVLVMPRGGRSTFVLGMGEGLD